MRRGVRSVALGVLVACGRVTVPAEESGAPEGEKALAGARGVAEYPKVVWVQGFDETLSIVDVALGKDGAIYVAADRSGGSPFFVPPAKHGPKDRFAIARLTPDGVVEWRRELLGSEVVLAGLEVDSDGSAYVCGWTSESVDFGRGVLADDLTFVFAGKLDAAGRTQWSTMIDSPLAWTHGCGLTSARELVIGVGMNVGEEGQVIGTKLSSDGEVAWTLVNHLPTHGPLNPSAAVGPDDTFYLYWETSGDPLDFGDGVARYGGPGLVASFSADNEVRWSAPTGAIMASSLVATKAGVALNGMNLSMGDEATELFDVETGASTWRWGFTEAEQRLIETGWFEHDSGAWVLGTDLSPYAFLAHVGADEVETTRIGFGASTWGGALARVDERHLLVGGDYVAGTVIAGEVLEGAGYFLALVETGP